MQCVIRHSFASGTVFGLKVVKIILAECLVYLIHQHTFSRIILQDAYSDVNLITVLFATLGLVLLVGVHPVKQVNSLFGFYTGLAVGQLDNTFGLDGIGGIHSRLILPTGIVIRFRNEIQLKIFVCSFSETVYIKIQTLASICQLLCPKADRLFYFCRLLYSWHIDPFIILFLLQRYE